MFKTILKIGYIAVCAILAVLFAILNYNTGADDNYVSYVSKADKSESTEDLVYAFSSFNLPYDSVPYAEANNNDGDIKKDNLSVYGTINQLTARYYENADAKEATKTFANVEFVYFFIIRFPDKEKYGTSSSLVNETGIRFYGSSTNQEGLKNKYDYHFVVSSSINKDDYLAKPTTGIDAIMKSERNQVITYSKDPFNYKFMLVAFSESMLGYINTQLNNEKITGFNMIDNKGNKVFAEDYNLSLDFSQDFFKNEALIKYRDAFKDYNNADGNTEEGKAIKETARNTINNLKIEDLNNQQYKGGLKKEDIYNAGLVWKVIGIVVLFVVSFSILYVLFFHFALIKRLIFRRKTSNTRYVPNKINNKNKYQPKAKTNTIDAKFKDVTNDKSSKKEDVTVLDSNDKKEENVEADKNESIDSDVKESNENEGNN